MEGKVSIGSLFPCLQGAVRCCVPDMPARLQETRSRPCGRGFTGRGSPRRWPPLWRLLLPSCLWLPRVLPLQPRQRYVQISFQM